MLVSDYKTMRIIFLQRSLVKKIKLRLILKGLTNNAQIDSNKTTQGDHSDRRKRRLIRSETAVKRSNSCRKRRKPMAVFRRFSPILGP
jgi:hypothetical protein